MASPGPSTQRYIQQMAANILTLARIEKGWTQRQLAEAAGVPVSTIGRIETGARQPSLVTLSKLLNAADLELRISVHAYDNHDDVLDARYATLDEAGRAAYDARAGANSALAARAREHLSAGQDGARQASPA